MASSDQVASARMAQMQMPMITQPAQMTMTRELMPTDTYRASDQLPISNMYMYRSDLLPNLGPAMINVEGEEVGCCCTKSTETVTFYASVVKITQRKQYFCPPLLPRELLARLHPKEAHSRRGRGTRLVRSARPLLHWLLCARYKSCDRRLGRAPICGIGRAPMCPRHGMYALAILPRSLLLPPGPYTHDQDGRRQKRWGRLRLLQWLRPCLHGEHKEARPGDPRRHCELQLQGLNVGTLRPISRRLEPAAEAMQTEPEVKCWGGASDGARKRGPKPRQSRQSEWVESTLRLRLTSRLESAHVERGKEFRLTPGACATRQCACTCDD